MQGDTPAHGRPDAARICRLDFLGRHAEAQSASDDQHAERTPGHRDTQRFHRMDGIRRESAIVPVSLSISPSCCRSTVLTNLVLLMCGRYGATTLLQLQIRKALNTWEEFVLMMAGAASRLEAAVAALSPRGYAHLSTNNCTQAHQPNVVMAVVALRARLERPFSSCL